DVGDRRPRLVSHGILALRRSARPPADEDHRGLQGRTSRSRSRGSLKSNRKTKSLEVRWTARLFDFRLQTSDFRLQTSDFISLRPSSWPVFSSPSILRRAPLLSCRVDAVPPHAGGRRRPSPSAWLPSPPRRPRPWRAG